jgi:hypothetical protein
VQNLLGHANSKITMDLYTQALSPAERESARPGIIFAGKE